MNLELKRILYNKCLALIDEKLKNALNAMENAQNSANEETKSGMGDKYETSRAMIQIEKEKYEIQAAEAIKIKQFLNDIDITRQYENVQPGCVIITNLGNFFVAVNVGELEEDSQKYFTISLASPIGQIFSGCKKDTEIQFRNKVYKILDIF